MKASFHQEPQNILLAVDGSEHSKAAISLLRDLPPFPWGCSVHIVNVMVPRDASEYASRIAMLKNTQSILEQKGYETTHELLVGYPGEILMECCEQRKPDMIVMGAKGLRASFGILLGGVAQQIVEYASCPVLVVRSPYTSLKRVLLLNDGSPSSQKAVEATSRFPFASDVDLRVVHVLPPMFAPDIYLRSWPTVPEAIPPFPASELAELVQIDAEVEERDGEALLDSSIETLRDYGLIAGKLLLRGDAATEVLQYAKDHAIDLIICGSRGLAQVKSWLLGSVSRKMVHYAQCSVMVVK